VHYGVSGAQNVDILFFMLRWDRYRFHKKCVGTHYAKQVFFLHPVGSVGHVVHSSPVRFSNKHTEKCYAKPMFLHAVGSAGHIVHSGPSGREMSRHYFSCLGGPGAVSIKSTPVHVTLNLWFCIQWDLRVT
jgi:hypothetical protein